MKNKLTCLLKFLSDLKTVVKHEEYNYQMAFNGV